MRTLAARSILSGRVEGSMRAVRAAALAAPLVLVDCGGAPHSEPRAAPVVVVEIPRPEAAAEPAQRESALGNEAGGRRCRNGLAPQQMISTALNLSYYPNFNGNMVVEARLSVIRPDDTLEKVILDPKVTFYYRDSSGRFYAIPRCKAVFSCDVSRVVKGHGITEIMASFAPEPDSPFMPSAARVTIDNTNGASITP
jgi:hypothetical protein